MIWGHKTNAWKEMRQNLLGYRQWEQRTQLLGVVSSQGWLCNDEQSLSIILPKIFWKENTKIHRGAVPGSGVLGSMPLQRLSVSALFTLSLGLICIFFTAATWYVQRFVTEFRCLPELDVTFTIRQMFFRHEQLLLLYCPYKQFLKLIAIVLALLSLGLWHRFAAVC